MIADSNIFGRVDWYSDYGLVKLRDPGDGT